MSRSYIYSVQHSDTTHNVPNERYANHFVNKCEVIALVAKCVLEGNAVIMRADKGDDSALEF